MDCIFCKIVNGEIPSDKIFEDDEVVAFLDIRPVNRGHSLVVPKKHFENILATPDEVLSTMIAHTKKIAAGIAKATGADGFNIGINTGVASGQTVFHTHLHIIPRFNNDGLKPWPHEESEPKTRAEMAAAIKKFL